MITYIEIEKLHPHPDNPRRSLGDLTELTESIKVSGVLQNLTVVPIPDMPQEYHVVIGNRRLAASIEAGLEVLPCSISDMDKKQQVATMLLENIQRDDLTVYEQAQGFQMMLDLGESIADISQKTGLSETTVRHRVKLCELDQDVLKEKTEDESRNITMFDLIRLEQIKDQKLKNKALAYIGTDDFAWQYKKAKEEEAENEKKAYVLERAASISEEIEDSDGKRFIGSIWLSSFTKEQLEEKIQAIEEKGEAAYFKLDKYGSINFYGNPIEASEEEETEEEKAVARAREEEEAKKEALDRICERMEEMRDDFVMKMTDGKLNNKKGLLLQYAAEHLCFGSTYSTFDEEALLIYSGLLKEDDDDDDGIEEDEVRDLIETAIKDRTLRVLFSAIYIQLTPYSWEKMYCYQRKFNSPGKTGKVYEFLEAFGYKTSTEERQMLDGTHELYLKEEPVDGEDADDEDSFVDDEDAEEVEEYEEQ